jgi:hypothetical protein
MTARVNRKNTALLVHLGTRRFPVDARKKGRGIPSLRGHHRSLRTRLNGLPVLLSVHRRVVVLGAV